MDSTLSPDPGSEPDNDDIPVPVDSLAIDGTRPQVGDKVDLQVGGTVTKVVNDNAWVTPETVNGSPIQHDADDDDSADPMAALSQMSAAAGPMGGGY